MDKYAELEKRIQDLEQNKISVIMSQNADMNVLRSIQRALSTNSLSIGSAGPTASALLELKSVNKGFVLPRMTTAQRDAIVNPVAGMLIFNTTTGVVNFHNGAAWAAI